MKKYHFIFLLIISLTIPLSSVLGASYSLFDKENKELLFMDKNDTQFSGKIDMEEKPDQIISTDDPNKYLAIYAPQAPKKAKYKTTQKGKSVLYSRN